MPQRFLLLFILISTSFAAISQAVPVDLKRNACFIEAGGVCGYGSINYERQFPIKKNLIFTARIGTSSYHIFDFENRFNPDLLVPVMINGLYGKSHKFEFGFGQLLSNIVQYNYSNYESKRSTNFHTISTIGYRYQKEEGRLILRINYTPIFESNKNLRHWMGMSVGVAF